MTLLKKATIKFNQKMRTTTTIAWHHWKRLITKDYLMNFLILIKLTTKLLKKATIKFNQKTIKARKIIFQIK